MVFDWMMTAVSPRLIERLSVVIVRVTLHEVSPSAIGMYEQNRREPSAATLVALSQVFGVSTDYLLGNVSDPFFHLDNDRILSEINSYETNNAPTETGERDILDEVDVAFYGDFKELNEDEKETVRDMVRLMRQRKEKRSQ